MEPSIIIITQDFSLSTQITKSLPNLIFECFDINNYEPEEIIREEKNIIFIFIDLSPFFVTWLEDSYLDHRIPRDYLSSLSCTVFSPSQDVARTIYLNLSQLSANIICPYGFGSIENWTSNSLQHCLIERSYIQISTNDTKISDIKDIEDITDECLDMITPSYRKAIKKQGYSLIGSHSAVKICRWNKNMIRGRGGCYKHSFYGINSHQCLEMTPSLACANKCVFCWRHNQNPVGKKWRWNVDNPDFILQESLKEQYQFMKSMKSIPGLIPQRYKESFQVQHCALSLVGDPLLYPYLNEYLDLLHHSNISSFVVTNAQFPEELQKLKISTQLYLSIDAPTPSSLHSLDRPLFQDYWSRYLQCLSILAQRPERTVLRLTLIKNYNMHSLDEYSSLIKMGNPSFIEIKGMTFCGDTKTNPLTMAEVPLWPEIIQFSQNLVSKLEDYTLCCVHEHSHCVLLSHNKFFINNQWYTWIDFKKFFELLNAQVNFTDLDYVCPTPSWSMYDSIEQGFDPNDTRYIRPGLGKKKNKKINL